MTSLYIRLLTALAIVSMASCMGTKHIPEGDRLYTGADISLVPRKIKDRKEIIKNAEEAVRPAPNKKFLGMRPKLWLYNVAGNPEKKGFRSWIKKMGEPPVLMSQVNPGQTARFIDAKLFNHGIFRSATESKVHEKKKTASVEYICHVHEPYKIKTLILPANDDIFSELIAANQKHTLIKPGEDYNLEKLKAERERIDDILKDNGYFYFNPDYLYFKADTSVSDKTVTLELDLKEETPYRALLIYRINDIYINSNYSLTSNRDSVKTFSDTLVYDGITFLNRRLNIRPKVIARSIFFRTNDIYSRKNHDITLNRLMSMGNFKFVSVRFAENDTSAPGFLNADVLLTQMPKRTFRAELDIVSKSNDFIGPKLDVNYKNRNTFNGAELLNLSLAGSFETQISGKYENLFSYEISPSIELYVPRFIAPFKIKMPSGYYIPKTKFAFGYSYLKWVDYFNLTSFKFSYGYKWKENIKKDHELNPVNINYTRISNKSQRFNALLESNPFLKKSYEEQFIAGMTYAFTFNEQVVENQKSQFYLNTTAELSGNALSLIKKTLYGQTPNPDDPLRVAGSIYSQFARGTIDIRNYFNFKNKNKIAVRFYTGIGKAYGNSSTLPYIKQFFSGGPNSIRAFLINSVGPGTHYEAENNELAFLEQGGDLKIEGNAEYRCNLVSILKGAVFIDAGNIWLLDSNPAIRSKPFAFSRFTDELAVGAGVGLRLDVTFFVLRFDLAAPLRKPWLPEGERWVIDAIRFGSPDWRSENLVLSIAIGYPF